MAAADRMPCRTIAGGVIVRVHLTPKSSRDAFGDIVDLPDGPALKVRVRALPEEGKANAALEELLAKELKLARSAVSVTGGHTSRLKSVTLTGEAQTLRPLIAALIT
jgi:uncharacterized protein